MVTEISNSKRWVDSILIRIHTYFNITLIILIFKVWSTHRTHTTYKYSWCYWFRLSTNRHLKVSQNKYDSQTNTTILSRRLHDCFACCLWHFLSTFFVNVATTKTVNFDECFKSFESFNLWIWMSRHMNQTYFECYEFDVNIVLMLIASYTYNT